MVKSQPKPAIRTTLAAAGYVGVKPHPVFAAREQRLLLELSALSAMRAASEVRRGR